MKQGKPVINSVIIALAVVLAVYFGFYVFNSFNTPYSSVLAYQYTLYDSAEAEGIMVRDEVVLPRQSGIVDVVRTEGERVGVGQTVALVYRDTQARENQEELKTLSLEYELLNYATAQGADVESAARLDEDIIQTMVELRGCVAENNYNQLEDQIVDVKSAVLKRGYIYGDGVTSEELENRRAQLKGEISALKRRSAGDTFRVTAKQAGTYSHMVDGMEELITPASAAGLDPVQLRSLIREGSQPDEEAVGKLVTSDRWSYAAVIPAQTAQRLRVGEYVNLRFTGDFSQDVLMRVDHLSKELDGEVAAVFSSDRYLARTTLLRQQTAELIFEDYSGLRVPKEALRMVKGTYTDEKTGQEQEYSQLGVYVVVAGRTEFKPVEVVAEGEDYYVLTPAGSDRKILRAGDEVITRATGLYAGQNFKE